VHAAVTVFDAEAGVRVTLNGKGALGDLTLPVDIAVSAEGKVAVVAAGASMVVETSLDAVVSTDALEACAQGSDRTFNVGGALAVAYGVGGELVIQSEVSLRIVQADGQIAEVPIAGPRVPHMGHALFHTAPAWPSAPVACASCHPEGRDDGRVWRFQGLGPRRTQTVLGGVLDTAPLHWEGDMDGLESLMGEVFVNRMGGVAPDETTLESLATFLQSMPALPAPDARDAAAAARGEALFRDPAVGCATCHAGEALTNDQTVYVGTGGAFQVPSLVGIADRAPFMHDGCATTLRDRFNPACGGGDAHGKTSQLAPEEIDDLVAFLETL
jgi:mono/diheme cytochrome c family protein